MHFLVIPKKRDGLTRLLKAEERHKALLGHLLFVAQHVAKQGEHAWRAWTCWERALDDRVCFERAAFCRHARIP